VIFPYVVSDLSCSVCDGSGFQAKSVPELRGQGAILNRGAFKQISVRLCGPAFEGCGAVLNGLIAARM